MEELIFLLFCLPCMQTNPRFEIKHIKALILLVLRERPINPATPTKAIDNQRILLFADRY